MKGIIVINPADGDTFRMCRHCWDTVGKLTHRQLQAQNPLIPDLNYEEGEIDECRICGKNKRDLN